MPLNVHTPMDGRTCLITGATSGHGLALAHALSRLGAELVLLARNPTKAEDVADALQRESPTRKRPTVLLADLASRADVDRAARSFLDARPARPLHVLVNNAGLVSLRREETVDGVERVLGVNYLALVQLTRRLLPRLQATGTPDDPARIINLSSDMHRMVRLGLDDLELRRRYSWWRSYAQSKLAIVYFTRELARRLGHPAPTGESTVTVNAVDPGPVRSGIAASSPTFVAAPTRWMMRWFFPSAARAARTALWMSTAPEVAPLTGHYFRFGRLQHPRVSGDPHLAVALWDRTADQLGLPR